MNKVCKSCKNKEFLNIKIFAQCAVSDGNIISRPLHKMFCKKCGLGFGINRYKLSNYHRTDGTSKFELNRHKKIANSIYKIITKIQNRTTLILEIGAANFETSYNLSLLNENLEVHAIEPYPEKENNFKNIHHVKSNFFDYNTNLKYDVIFSNNVIEHIRDIESFLRKSACLLEKNGLIIVCCPSFVNISTELLFADHLWHITSQSLENLCNQANLFLNKNYISTWDKLTHVYLIKKEKFLPKEKDEFNKFINVRRECFYQRWKEADNNVSKLITKRNFVIFGAGEFTQLIRVYMPKTYKLIKYIIVNHEDGNRYFDKPIININKFNYCEESTQILLGIKKSDRNKVIRLLKSFGVKEKSILKTLI